MKLITAIPKQHFVACILCALFISGCSGSDDSSAIEQDNIVNGDDSTASNIQPPLETQVPSSDQDNVDDSASDVQSPTNVPNSSSQATTLVTFDITVPAYMSNELQVQLESGDINTTATFVNDESWSVSGVFTTNTDNLSVVTFADSNGAVTLGTAEISFRTSTATTSQTVQLTADQFDTDRWDSDNDGVSNLSELIAGTNPDGDDALESVQASLELVPDKTFRVSWQPSTGATFYRVLENANGISGFTDVSGQLEADSSSFDHRVALYARVNAEYLVQSCNVQGCVDSAPVMVSGTLDNAIGYFKASNPGADDFFGRAVSISADGNTLAVGADGEASSATNPNGDQNDDSIATGAAYVFIRNSINGLWQQQAYLKASNSQASDRFGESITLSADGNTVVVGAHREDSAAAGVNGVEGDNSVNGSGAAYVFVRNGESWEQQAYLKASNPEEFDQFGLYISLSADGDTLAVGSVSEDSAAIGVNSDQNDNSAFSSGAVYIFVRSGLLWQQQAYLKASNTESGDRFGSAVSLSADGNTLAVGAHHEDSAATSIDGDQGDNTAENSGAVYVFVRSGTSDGIDVPWQQQSYLKASNSGSRDQFGEALSLSADGNTLAVGAHKEGSAATSIDGDQGDNTTEASGAVYVFVRSGISDGLGVPWQQQVYLKASNTDVDDQFGVAVSISADGNTLAVSAHNERSAATGINGDQIDNSLLFSGAVYVFGSSDGLWQQQAYLKASNTETSDRFGAAISLSASGNTLAVGAESEDSATTGINGDQTNNSAKSAGAVYLY